MGFIPDFNIGSIISNQKLYTTFKCGNMGGMRRSTRLKCLVLISDYTKDLYEDRWIDDELHYTGMGKIGDQKLSSQNKTLYYSKDNDIEIHLFEVLKPQQYTYRGVFELSNKPYRAIQKDITGQDRKVWIFPMKFKK